MIHYFLCVSLSWFLFYLIYVVFLQRETFFKSNRWYLLSSFIAGLLLPLVHFLTDFTIAAESNLIEDTAQIISSSSEGIVYYFSTVEGQTAQISTSPLAASHKSILHITWSQVMMMLYLLGVFLAVAKMIYGLYQIYRVYKSATIEEYKNGVCLAITDRAVHPFSFFKYVFLSPSTLNHPELRQIINHETEHIKGHHTLDMLLLELVGIFFWWNPMIHLYRKSLKQTHEYLADQYASLSIEKKKYGHILLGHSSSGTELALTHSFFNSHLKKRIDMLFKEKSVASRKSRYLLVLPLLAFLVLVFSCSSEISLDDNQPPRELVEIMDELTNGEMNADHDIIYSILKGPKEEFANEMQKLQNAMGATKVNSKNALLTNYTLLVNDARFTPYKNYIEKRFNEAAEKKLGKELFFYPVNDGHYGLQTSLLKTSSIEQEIDRILEKKLSDYSVFRALYSSDMSSMERMKLRKEGKDLLGIYTELVNDPRYNSYKKYIEKQLIVSASYHGMEVSFTAIGDDEYSMETESIVGRNTCTVIDLLIESEKVDNKDLVLYILNGKPTSREYLNEFSPRGYSLRIYTDKDDTDRFLNLYDPMRTYEVVVRIETGTFEE